MGASHLVKMKRTLTDELPTAYGIFSYVLEETPPSRLNLEARHHPASTQCGFAFVTHLHSVSEGGQSKVEGDKKGPPRAPAPLLFPMRSSLRHSRVSTLLQLYLGLAANTKGMY